MKLTSDETHVILDALFEHADRHVAHSARTDLTEDEKEDLEEETEEYHAVMKLIDRFWKSLKMREIYYQPTNRAQIKNNYRSLYEAGQLNDEDLDKIRENIKRI